MNAPAAEPPAPDYKYWAFISYSHQDNLATRGDGSTDHIQWANWLHEQLETFRIPDGYRDRPTRTGEPMPERFFPTFRDEAELPTSHDLGGQIRDALERSRFLIVIASPRSARSRYVNEEVRCFRELGRGDRILVLITDGEPNVRHHPKAGWTAADDCFCPALVHPLKADGTVDDTQLLSEEPIAADVRVKDTEPPREMRVSESSQQDRQGVLDFMRHKIIAGLMGAGLDEMNRLLRDESLRQENNRVSELLQQVQELRHQVRLLNEQLKTASEVKVPEDKLRTSVQGLWEVFISAKSADYPLARQVFEFLKTQQIETFLSDDSLPRLGNSDYRKEIDRALEQANHMVVVASSRENVEAPWVEAEWGFFINEKRSGRKSGNLVTMLAEGFLPNLLPPSLRYYEALSLDGNGLQKLFSYVHHRTDLPPSCCDQNSRLTGVKNALKVRRWIGFIKKWAGLSVAAFLLYQLLKGPTTIVPDLGVSHKAIFGNAVLQESSVSGLLRIRLAAAPAGTSVAGGLFWQNWFTTIRSFNSYFASFSIYPFQDTPIRSDNVLLRIKGKMGGVNGYS